MATQTTTGAADAFYKQLGRMYGTYAGGFIAFVIFLAILEQVGVPNKVLGYLFVFFTLAVYAIIGVMTRTAQLSEYYVAGRRVPAFYNGMATGADWMSAASFVGMAGTLFLLGYDGLAWVLGWTGGFVLVSILVGPYLRKFGAYTVPDFMAFRFGGNFARFLAVVVLVCCSFTYVTAQIYGTGLIASRFLGMPVRNRGVRGTRRHPALRDAGRHAGGDLDTDRPVHRADHRLSDADRDPVYKEVRHPDPATHLRGGDRGNHGARRADAEGQSRGALHGGELSGRGAEAAHRAVHQLLAAELLRHHLLHDGRHGFAAAHPDALFHHAVSEGGADSVAWSLLFIFLLYFSAPAYAAFSKLEVYTNIIGRDLTAVRPWMFSWGELGLIQICGKNAASIDAIVAACKAIAGHPGVVRLQDFVINTDVIVLSTPEIAGLPYVISGLVAAGGLAAALSTADGLLLAIANALSHDIYYKMLDPNAATIRRLTVARVLLFFVAVASAALAATKPGDILAMVGWAFSLAMAGNFPVLVMGIWWKRATTAGAISRHDRRLRPLPVLPGRQPLLPRASA